MEEDLVLAILRQRGDGVCEGLILTYCDEPKVLLRQQVNDACLQWWRWKLHPAPLLPLPSCVPLPLWKLRLLWLLPSCVPLPLGALGCAAVVALGALGCAAFVGLALVSLATITLVALGALGPLGALSALG